MGGRPLLFRVHSVQSLEGRIANSSCRVEKKGKPLGSRHDRQFLYLYIKQDEFIERGERMKEIG
jgi:hypothetical protein